MPSVYLSPSLQEFNSYIGGGNEEYYMNLIADEMVPYLVASGITFARNRPDQTLSQVINESNSYNYDFHLAIHSNASPPDLSGAIRGTDIYYSKTNESSKRAADIIENNFKAIYPEPSLVKTVETNTLAEVRNVKSANVLIEIAYHDNIEDATWIRNNIEEIAKNLALSLTEYFDIPLINPTPIRIAAASGPSGFANIQSKPLLISPIVGEIPNGSELEIVGEFESFYVVKYNNLTGYVLKDSITVN